MPVSPLNSFFPAPYRRCYLEPQRLETAARNAKSACLDSLNRRETRRARIATRTSLLVRVAKSAVLGFPRLVVFLFGGNPRIKTPQVEHLFKTGGLRTISHTRGAYPKDGFNRRRSMGGNLD
jgi:hypothetical protein